MCVCNSLLPCYRLLQLAPATECIHITSSGHHHCLTWSLATRPWGITEDPNSSSSRSPTVLTKDYAVGDVDPSSLSCWDVTLSTTTSLHAGYLAPRDPRSLHAPVCPRLQVKVFPDQSQDIKSRRGDCFFKCVKLQGSWRIRETWHTKGTQSTSSNWPWRNGDTWPSWQGIQNNFVLKMCREPQENTEQFNEVGKMIQEPKELH